MISEELKSIVDAISSQRFRIYASLNGKVIHVAPYTRGGKK